MASSFEQAIAYALQCLDCPSLQLKNEQKASLRAVYSGKDTLVWLPTGFGKTLCYTALPFLFDHKLGHLASDRVSLVVVVSPLISLMTDQVVNLRAKGVNAAIMSMGDRVQNDLLASERDLEKCSLLFCAPEALMGSRWREALQTPAISLLYLLRTRVLYYDVPLHAHIGI